MCLSRARLLVSIAQTLYGNSFDHGILHVERVLNWAKGIVKYEKLDLNEDILVLTVYLHDMGRFIGEPHAYYSTLIAETLLRELRCPDDIVSEILGAISTHSYSYVRAKNTPPQSVLGKVLSDADKLDALGIVGFLRVFIYGERANRDINYSINHFYEKISNLKYKMYYEYSKRVAEKLSERTMKLLNTLRRELQQEPSSSRI